MVQWSDIENEIVVVSDRISRLTHARYDYEVDDTPVYSYTDFPYYMDGEHPELVDICNELLEAYEIGIDQTLQDCFCCSKCVMDDLITGIIEKRKIIKQIREFLKEVDECYRAAERDSY